MASLPLETPVLAQLHAILPDSSLRAEIPEKFITSFGSSQAPQTAHRINIINAWGGKTVFEGHSVLELGCGQGDASVVLAAAASDEAGKGRVLGWDPARADYGSPLTLDQAQRNLLEKKELQDRLSFSLTSPLEAVLAPGSHQYDIATLLHCIYYFPSPSVLLDTLKVLRSHTPPIQTLCLAEYALRASSVDQNAHVMAVLAQSALESMKGDISEANVQTVLSPQQIKDLAVEAGWRVRKEEIISPELDLQDGRWEVGTVLSQDWVEEASEVIEQVDGMSDAIKARQRAWVMAARQATVHSADLVHTRDRETDSASSKSRLALVRTMDVWCAVFGRAE